MKIESITSPEQTACELIARSSITDFADTFAYVRWCRDVAGAGRDGNDLRLQSLKPRSTSRGI